MGIFYILIRVNTEERGFTRRGWRIICCSKIQRRRAICRETGFDTTYRPPSYGVPSIQKNNKRLVSLGDVLRHRSIVLRYIGITSSSHRSQPGKHDVPYDRVECHDSRPYKRMCAVFIHTSINEIRTWGKIKLSRDVDIFFMMHLILDDLLNFRVLSRLTAFLDVYERYHHCRYGVKHVHLYYQERVRTEK